MVLEMNKPNTLLQGTGVFLSSFASIWLKNEMNLTEKRWDIQIREGETPLNGNI